jgi:hypothetical protein
MVKYIAELQYDWHDVVYYRTQRYTCVTAEFKGKKKKRKKEREKKWEGKRKHSMPMQKDKREESEVTLVLFCIPQPRIELTYHHFTSLYIYI